MKTGLMAICLAASGLMLFPLAVRGSVLALETFNYPEGSAINGKTGGTGWGNAWGGGTGYAFWTSTVPGLAAAAYQSPDSCMGGTNFASNTKGISRKFNFTNTTDVVYLGLMARHTASTGYGYLSVSGDSAHPFRLGWAMSAPNKWYVQALTALPSTFQTANTTNPVVQGQAILAVLRMNLDTKVVSLFINQTTEGTPNAVATGAVATTFHTFNINLNNGAVMVDDLRVGTAFADVVPRASRAAGTVMMVQ